MRTTRRPYLLALILTLAFTLLAGRAQAELPDGFTPALASAAAAYPHLVREAGAAPIPCQNSMALTPAATWDMHCLGYHGPTSDAALIVELGMRDLGARIYREWVSTRYGPGLEAYAATFLVAGAPVFVLVYPASAYMDAAILMFQPGFE